MISRIVQMETDHPALAPALFTEASLRLCVLLSDAPVLALPSDPRWAQKQKSMRWQKPKGEHPKEMKVKMHVVLRC